MARAISNSKLLLENGWALKMGHAQVSKLLIHSYEFKANKVLRIYNYHLKINFCATFNWRFMKQLILTGLLGSQWHNIWLKYRGKHLKSSVYLNQIWSISTNCFIQDLFPGTRQRPPSTSSKSTLLIQIGCLLCSKIIFLMPKIGHWKERSWIEILDTAMIAYITPSNTQNCHEL